MDTAQALKEIETTLRRPESDRDYLADQLLVLATVVAKGKDQESGLVRGALGGLQYVMDRLREIWKEPESPEPKTLEELKQIFAGVELSRFAKSQEDVDKTLEIYRKDCILVDVHRVRLSDGDIYYVFASKKDQTTVDGQKLLKGELLDSHTALTPSFQVICRELLKD